jgi:hypothetical protein
LCTRFEGWVAERCTIERERVRGRDLISTDY